MKQLLALNKETATQSFLALHLMVSELSKSIPSRIHEKTIVNDIPAGLRVSADQHQLAAVIGSLLDTVIGHTRSKQIRISAKSYGNVTLLHIKDKSQLNSPDFANSLVDVQELAEKLNGNVSVTSYRNEVTTVAFSFMNLPDAA